MNTARARSLGARGSVAISSEVDRGTKMYIYLPRRFGVVGPADADAEIEAEPRAEDGETVLVVDDEPTVRM